MSVEQHGRAAGRLTSEPLSHRTETAAQTTSAQLLCLPHAGAVVSEYSGWADLLGDGTEVISVELPGHGSRLSEIPLASMKEIIDWILETLLHRDIDRLALFGHSMGAVVAFELARALEDREVYPVHLFASGCVPPARRRSQRLQMPQSDHELLSWVTELDGTPQELLENPQFLAFFLPSLRADLYALKTYSFEQGSQITCPITALGGSADPLRRACRPLGMVNAHHRCVRRTGSRRRTFLPARLGQRHADHLPSSVDGWLLEPMMTDTASGSSPPRRRTRGRR